MAEPRRERNPEVLHRQHVKAGLARGYTLAYAEMKTQERRAWILCLIQQGASNVDIRAATGVGEQWAETVRSKADPLPKKERGKRSAQAFSEDRRVPLDTGAYMDAVRRLGVAPPQSWRFGPDLRRLPAPPAVHQSIVTSTGGWCSDEGEDFRPTDAQKARHRHA